MTSESQPGESDADEPPRDAIERAEELTRLARAAVDDNEAAAYREERAGVLGEYDFTARVREDEGSETLVCHPVEWVEDGVIEVDRIEDTDRAIEVPLSGAGDPDDWAAIAAENDRVVERVAEEHGEVHAANARAFADFMGNHYARTVGSAGRVEIEEFLTEYFPRNAWPSEKQRAVVEESIELVSAVAGDEGTTVDTDR